jgi:hypothetical protein
MRPVELAGIADRRRKIGFADGIGLNRERQQPMNPECIDIDVDRTAPNPGMADQARRRRGRNSIGVRSERPFVQADNRKPFCNRSKDLALAGMRTRQAEKGILLQEPGKDGREIPDIALKEEVVLEDQHRPAARGAFLPKPIVGGKAADLASRKRAEGKRVCPEKGREFIKIKRAPVYTREELSLQPRGPELSFGMALPVRRALKIDDANVHATIQPAGPRRRSWKYRPGSGAGEMAGAEGLEPTAYGFGDRRSTN